MPPFQCIVLEALPNVHDGVVYSSKVTASVFCLLTQTYQGLKIYLYLLKVCMYGGYATLTLLLQYGSVIL